MGERRSGAVRVGIPGTSKVALREVPAPRHSGSAVNCCRRYLVTGSPNTAGAERQHDRVAGSYPDNVDATHSAMLSPALAAAAEYELNGAEPVMRANSSTVGGIVADFSHHAGVWVTER